MNLKHLLTKLNPFHKKVEAASVEMGSQAEEVVEPIEPTEPIEVPKKKPPLMKGGNWKLSEMDKQLVVGMYATGLTSAEIVERMRMEHNVEISQGQVFAYARSEKWQPTIKKLRERHMEDIASVAGSHKKVRLQRAETVYDKAIGRNKLDIALKATEAQRREMEDGAAVHLTLNQFNNYSDDELKMKHLEVMKKISQLDKQKGLEIGKPTDKTETSGS